MKKLIFIRITFIFLALILAESGVSARAGEDSRLADLIRQAEDRNPRIKAAYHKWKAAEHRIKTVRSLDDPMMTYGYFGEEIQTRVGPQEQRFGVSQKVPFPGKLGLRSKAQSSQAEMFKQEYLAVKNEVIKDVKLTYYDLYWADKAIDISNEEKEILESLQQVTQRRYESNLTPQQNVIKIQVELSKIIRKVFQLKQNRESLEVKLNSLLNRDTETPVEMIASVDGDKAALDLGLALKTAGDSRQELLAAEMNVDKARHEKTLARMAYLPDFTIGAEFIEIGGGTTMSADDGQDAWVAMLSVNVPIWFGKLSRQVKEKEDDLQAALHRRQSVENDVVFEVTDAHLKINTYKDIVLLYETALLPQARQAFEASQTGFETGEVSFIDWLDTQRTYLQTRLAYHKAISDYYKSIALMERFSGKNLKGVSNE